MADKGRVKDSGASGEDSRGSAGQPIAQARKRINFRFIKSEIDKPFFILVLVLLVFGIVMMFSASYAWGLSEYNDGYHYVKNRYLPGFSDLWQCSLCPFWIITSSRIQKWHI